MADRGPTLRRRELGAALRDLRNNKSLTIEDVAGELLCSPTKISRIETAQRAASLRDVRDLCRIYGVDDDRTTQLMRLARESRERGWWQEYSDVSSGLSTLIGLEAAATSVQSFESAFIPGLLQTESYSRTVVRGNRFPVLDDEAVEERVRVRMRRQERIRGSSPLEFWAVIDEAAVRRIIGSAEVMREQLLKLIEISRLRNVTLQIVPLSAGAYPGLEASAFSILKFVENLPDVVYVEGVLGELFAERHADLARIAGVFDQLRAEALSPVGSRELMAEIAEILQQSVDHP